VTAPVLCEHPLRGDNAKDFEEHPAFRIGDAERDECMESLTEPEGAAQETADATGDRDGPIGGDRALCEQREHHEGGRSDD
jgi:hypothetical protein